ncbi:hypothetical protein BVY10_06075 [Pseudomonas amygdali pv. morsprunorum]|nr:hypothetical protein BVY10_06075 [Pseudomonas amygdali pv. morsprunorum]
MILALGGVLAYFIGLLIRQKTIYNYTIKTNCAHLEYYLHYPDFASSFFKGIAIAVILIFVFIAALTGSLLFLVGPQPSPVSQPSSYSAGKTPFTMNKACPGMSTTL